MTDTHGTGSIGSAPWRAAEASRLLDFAARSRRPEGGFSWLDDTGRPLAGRPVYTWITCRMTHVFALAQQLQDAPPDAGELVAHGVRALLGPLRDAEHGGWWPSVGGPGAQAGSREAYDHAFVLLAASSALTVGAPGAQQLFDEAARVVDERFWDDDAGTVVETWDAGWGRLDPYRGANSNMHMTEALLAAHVVTGDRAFAERAQRITARIVATASACEWRLPEHYDDQWRPLMEYNRDKPADPFRPYGSTVGHGLEWSRLALHLRAVESVVTPQDGERLLDAAQHLFDRAMADGWARDGAAGLVYTVDWQGTPVVRDRMHWVVAEAIAAAAVLESVTHDERYTAWQRELWGYAAEHLLDPVGGSWLHQLDGQNHPTDTVWPGKPDIYHALQAVLLPGAPVTPGVLSSLARPGA